MAKIDYISRHPMREFTQQLVTALVKDDDGNWNLKEDYSVVIPVDSSSHNQDPFVFHYPWINAFCRTNSFSHTMGSQSIISWGAWNKDKSKFLVDTVFVVGNSFYWGNSKPNEKFRNEYPYKPSDPIYKYLFRYADDKPKKKRILTAHHNTTSYTLNPTNRFDEFFSFIPLKIDGDIFKPIDILPFINTHYPNSFSNIEKRQNGIINIDYALKLITYIYNNADILVLKCDDRICHPKPDISLQNKYYAEVYGAKYKIAKKTCANKKNKLNCTC